MRDETTFIELYARHFALVWRALGYFGVAADAREDAAQEVWVVAHRRLESLETPGKAAPWLWGIARRVAADHRRARARATRCMDALSATVATAPASEVPRAETRRTVQDLLGSLPDEQRIAIVLTSVEGMTGPEVAQVLGVSVNTVYSRIRLAREHIDRALAEAVDERVPDEKTRARCLAGVLALASAPTVPPMTPPSPASSTANVTSGAVKLWHVSAAALGVAAVVATGLGLTGDRSEVPEVVARVPAPDRKAALPEREGSDVARPPRAPDARDDAPRDDAPRDAVEPEQELARPRASTRVHERVHERAQRERAPVNASRDEAASPNPSLADELALLTPAADALRRGDPQGAIASLQDHARRFADSELWDVREATWIRALCLLGEHEAAQRRVDAALAVGDAPSSIRTAQTWCGAATPSHPSPSLAADSPEPNGSEP